MTHTGENDNETLGPPAERGPKGDHGQHGDQGERGAHGERGFKGQVGERGDAGLQGQLGEQGDTGIRDSKGVTGERGDTGLQGAMGERGQQGDHGQHGERGERGETGETGAPGKSSALTRNVTASYLFLLIVSVAAILLLTHQVRETRKLSRNLCAAINDNRKVLRDEHTAKLTQTKRYLKAHPQGFGGISLEVIMESLANEQAVLRAVKPVPCSHIGH